MVRHFFGHNQIPKLISFLIAVMLWLFAVSGATRTGLFPGSVALTIDHVPDSLVATANVDSVRVRLAADPLVWRRLTPASFTATVDLTGQMTGVVELPVQLTLSVSNVQVLDIIPKTVEVNIEPFVEKRQAVEVTTDGEAANGYFASVATIDPPMVTVRGGQSALDRLDRVAAIVHIGGAADEREETSPVQMLDTSGRSIDGLTATPRTVRIRQPLTKLAASKTVSVRVVTSGSPPVGKLVTPTITKPVTVTVAGSAAALSALTTVPTKPIDLAPLTQRTTVHTTLDLPSGVTLAGSTAIDVSFEVEDYDATVAVSPKLIFTNLGPDRRVASVDPAAPTIVLRGSVSKLAAVTSGEVTLTLDLAGRDAGVSQIVLSANQVHLPDGVSLQQLVTSALTVTLQ